MGKTKPLITVARGRNLAEERMRGLGLMAKDLCETLKQVESTVFALRSAADVIRIGLRQ